MISFRNVDKVYPNGVKGLNNVTLDIEQGEFVAIIGLSGAGKSTLIRTINRMHDITAGTLTVDGIDVSKLKGKELRRFRRKIGMIFQSFNLVTRSTVIKNVLTSMVPDMPWYKTLLGLYSKEQKMQALEAIDKVGILDKAYSRCDELSGGQQQRVALARALAITPDVLLMDEPLSNLDAKLRIEMRTVIKGIQNDVGITTVYVTHDQEEAMAVSDRIAVMNHGDIQQIGTPKVLYQRPANLFVATFIGHTNVLDGKLKIKNGKAYLSLAGDYEVEVDTIKDDEKKDQPVKASIRPEELVVDVKGNEGLKATVDDAVFLGLNTHYFVHLVDGEKLEIIQESQIDSMIEKGTDIRLKIKTEKINIFDEAGDHNLVKGVINDYDVYKE